MPDIKQPTPDEIRAARAASGLSAREAAERVGVSQLSWQRWEGQASKTPAMPIASWHWFLLQTGQHPQFTLTEKPAAEDI